MGSEVFTDLLVFSLTTKYVVFKISSVIVKS